MTRTTLRLELWTGLRNEVRVSLVGVGLYKVEYRSRGSWQSPVFSVLTDLDEAIQAACAMTA